MRDLHHDSGAVARLVVGSLSAAMGHMLKHRQSLVDDGMMLAAVDFHDKPHAASVVLIIREYNPLLPSGL